MIWYCWCKFVCLLYGCARGGGGGEPLREGDRGLTLFMSHFSNFLSALGRVFQIFCPL